VISKIFFLKFLTEEKISFDKRFFSQVIENFSQSTFSTQRIFQITENLS